jgi:hypothetical protein
MFASQSIRGHWGIRLVLARANAGKVRVRSKHDHRRSVCRGVQRLEAPEAGPGLEVVQATYMSSAGLKLRAESSKAGAGRLLGRVIALHSP